MNREDYRAEIAAFADEHGFTEGHPLRAHFMVTYACGWLEAKDRHLQALGLARRCGEAWISSPAGESQNVTPIRRREAHSHATKGRR